MMKSKLSVLLFSALLSAAACSEETVQAPEPAAENENPVEIVFSAGVGTAGAGAEAETAADAADTRTIYTHTGSGLRAEWKGSDDYPADYDRVGIVVIPVDSKTIIEGSNNIPYKATTSGKRSPLEADGTSLGGLVRGTTYRFLSYYPYDAAQKFSDNVLYYVCGETDGWRDSQRQTQAAPNDMSHLSRLLVMCAEPVTVLIPEEGVPAVDFNYKHALSTLQMKITNQRDEPVAVTQIDLDSSDWWILKQISIVNNSLFRTGLWQRLIVAEPAALGKGAEAQSFWLAIVNQSADSVRFKVITDKGTYVFTKPLPAGGLLTRRNYTLDIVIPQTPGEGETWTPAT